MTKNVSDASNVNIEGDILRTVEHTNAARKAPASAPSDGDLVARCREGDRTAWRLLYERHSPTVHRFICALGVPEHEREDACQEVFMAIYRSLGRFRGDARLSTWIYRIAARGANRLVQRRRLNALLSTLLLREPPPAPGPDPSEKTARVHLLDDLLKRLHPKKRMVLVLFEIEGLPIEEIAKIVGCPENTVWSRLHHARSELTKMASRRAS
jgi:RNA polymerase sigma-70 factor (ECF subfamily)